MTERLLAMNPFVDIHIHPAPESVPIDISRIQTITVRCPVRGRGLVIRDLTSAAEPALFAFFASLVARDGELELDSDAPLLPELARIGFLVADDDVVDWPAFEVPLRQPALGARSAGDAPSVVGPHSTDSARWARTRALEDVDWIVSPTFRFQPAFALHPGVAWPRDYDEQEGRLRCFAPGPAFWIGDPAELAAPYWVTDEVAALLANLRPGNAPPSLPAPLATALARVGALVPADRTSRVSADVPTDGPPRVSADMPGDRRSRVSADVHADRSARAGTLNPADRPPPAALARFAGHRTAYQADGFVVACDLLGADETAALRRYYGALLAAGLIPFGDRQNAARFSIYNDPVGRFVHARLAGAMSAIAGQRVAPSFSYFFSYLEGAALAPHKDRPQAEFSISLQIDHTPPPDAATGWPLCFTFDDGRCAAADLAIGDAVLYHGRAVTHHRAPLPAGQRSSLLVLEYVPHDFRGLLI